MNLPNALTVLRILLIPFFIGFLTYGHYLWALWTILIAGVTDILDGVIARMANQRTKLGAYLDPLADKLLLSSSFVTFSILHLVPGWVAIVVVSRALISAPATMMRSRLTTPIATHPGRRCRIDKVTKDEGRTSLSGSGSRYAPSFVR